MSEITEIWKDIEGLYRISNHGRVKSLGNGNSNNSKVRILKPIKTQQGYSSGNISNCCNKKCKTYKGYIWKYKI